MKSHHICYFLLYLTLGIISSPGTMRYDNAITDCMFKIQEINIILIIITSVMSVTVNFNIYQLLSAFTILRL